MIESGQVRGAVVVQSYDPAIRYSHADRALLAYLSQNILTTLARREAAEEMERRVAERTLALRQEISERLQGERLQTALFRIAEVENTSETMDGFYRSIHGIVSELLDARNFYVGLVSDNGEEIDFPFSVDEKQQERYPSRKYGHGVSEHVIRTGKPLREHVAGLRAMEAAGEFELFGAAATSWLGVPLTLNGNTIGVIAVQTYDRQYQYSARDEELLSFVSFHIANALARRRANESLHIANLQLAHASQTDPLTGLHNRRYLASQLPIDLAFYEREQLRSGDTEQALVFAIVDIDHFKRINDTYGHKFGDSALQMFANVLKGLVQTGDYVVRWGGEEFLLVFRPMPRQAVSTLGERIRHTVAQHVFELGESVRVALTCSIGLAEYPLLRDATNAIGWEQTVELADAALYWVKNNGRDGWASLRPTESSDRTSLLQSLQAGSQGRAHTRPRMPGITLSSRFIW